MSIGVFEIDFSGQCFMAISRLSEEDYRVQEGDLLMEVMFEFDAGVVGIKNVKVLKICFRFVPWTKNVVKVAIVH